MSNFNNIPAELQELRQWVVWRLEKREGAKPTKVPYSPWPNGGKASVADNPARFVVAKETWGTFEAAVSAPFTCIEPCDSNLPVEQTGFSGIGFVFTEDDPYCGVDLDDCHGDTEAYARQLKLFRDFNSYSELSPGGNGLHIIIKGKIGRGRRRASIELYDKERYFTFTGNVQNNMPIQERQEILSLLWEQMGGPAENYTYGEDSEQKISDEEVISMASGAVNGEKFNRLFQGDWQSMYSSQSEADFAIIDIISFYSENAAQIARIFRSSVLGERAKAQRDDYVGYMIRKSFDRKLPKVDFDGIRIEYENRLAAAQNGQALATASPNSPAHTIAQANDLGPPQAARTDQSHSQGVVVNGIFPPGLLGEISQFILDASPRPVPEIALAGGIALLAGITGRAYNISGSGLNQYILLLADTGRGKDAISSGISKLMQAVQPSCPSIGDFKGPGQLASSPALIKWLAKKPCCVSIFGEIGVLLQQMANPNANPHIKGLEGTLLQMYSKSGQGNVFDPMAYSDSDKNVSAINSPSYTIIGESVPDRFYEVLDEGMIATGLMPRFMVFEYKGKREYLKEGTEHVLPPFGLTQTMSDLSSHCLALAHNGNVTNVAMDNEATQLFREFEKTTTDYINDAKNIVLEELWNRAHLKAIKLAAVCAVGMNYHNPIITRNETMWATNMIVSQTEKLIAKFETGAIGRVGGSENKQLEEVCKVIARYCNQPIWEQPKCNIDDRMHKVGIITESVISRRVNNLAAFRQDKMNATYALKRTLKILLDGDELREVPKAQMIANFGSGPKAYVVSNPARFIEYANKLKK